MGGMMSNAVPNLKELANASRVEGVRYCRDTYEVATADGRKRRFFERSLRLKRIPAKTALRRARLRWSPLA